MNKLLNKATKIGENFVTDKINKAKKIGKNLGENFVTDNFNTQPTSQGNNDSTSQGNCDILTNKQKKNNAVLNKYCDLFKVTSAHINADRDQLLKLIYNQPTDFKELPHFKEKIEECKENLKNKLKTYVEFFFINLFSSSSRRTLYTYLKSEGNPTKGGNNDEVIDDFLKSKNDKFDRMITNTITFKIREIIRGIKEQIKDTTFNEGLDVFLMKLIKTFINEAIEEFNKETIDNSFFLKCVSKSDFLLERNIYDLFRGGTVKNDNDNICYQEYANKLYDGLTGYDIFENCFKKISEESKTEAQIIINDVLFPKIFNTINIVISEYFEYECLNRMSVFIDKYTQVGGNDTTDAFVHKLMNLENENKTKINYYYNLLINEIFNFKMAFLIDTSNKEMKSKYDNSSAFEPFFNTFIEQFSTVINTPDKLRELKSTFIIKNKKKTSKIRSIINSRKDVFYNQKFKGIKGGRTKTQKKIKIKTKKRHKVFK